MEDCRLRFRRENCFRLCFELDWPLYSGAVDLFLDLVRWDAQFQQVDFPQVDFGLQVADFFLQMVDTYWIYS